MEAKLWSTQTALPTSSTVHRRSRREPKWGSLRMIVSVLSPEKKPKPMSTTTNITEYKDNWFDRLAIDHLSQSLQSVSVASVFLTGDHPVSPPINIDYKKSSSVPNPPAKPLLVFSPEDKGEYPVVLLLHGYLLDNNNYSQLMKHVASHGYIVVAPQLYIISGQDATEDIKAAAAIANWLPAGLPPFLPSNVTLDESRFVISGHSRGGKGAFGVTLGVVPTSIVTNIKISALIGIDPVDGTGPNNHSTPQILTGNPFLLDIPVMVLGGGLSSVERFPPFPACAPTGVNHKDFFDECSSPPAYYFVARDYGHMDMLDDDTTGIKGLGSYCLCKNGKDRGPMRVFVGGVMVAFMKAVLFDDDVDLHGIRDDPSTVPVVLSEISFRE